MRGYLKTECLEQIIAKVSQNTNFGTIDFKSAYSQIPLCEGGKRFTAFKACARLYQFERLVFWLTDKVPIFQRIIDEVISKLKLEKTCEYLDDQNLYGT